MIDEARAEECFTMLSQLINTDDNSSYNFEGSEIKIEDFVPMFMKHLLKLTMKYEERTEGIMNFMVDAIQYSLKYTDEAPRFTLVTAEEMDIINHNGHEEPKFKVKTK